MDLNRVTLLGNIENEPTITFSKDGKVFGSFTLLTCFHDYISGEKITTKHKINVVNTMAEMARDRLKQNSRVYLEGRIKKRKTAIGEIVTEIESTYIDFSAHPYLKGGKNGR